MIFLIELVTQSIFEHLVVDYCSQRMLEAISHLLALLSFSLTRYLPFHSISHLSLPSREKYQFVSALMFARFVLLTNGQAREN